MRAVDLELFKPELVFFDFEAANSDELFEKLANELAPYGYIKDSWLTGIKEREETYPTGLVFETVSVALPHVDPEHLTSPISPSSNQRSLLYLGVWLESMATCPRRYRDLA